MFTGQLELNGLKALAFRKFESSLREDWTEEDLSECVREVYENKHRDCLLLRPAVVRAMREHLCMDLLGTTF